MEVTASEFARQAGVTKQTVSSNIKNGILIKNSGGKIDTDNPVNAGYLARKRQESQDAVVAAQVMANTIHLPKNTTVNTQTDVEIAHKAEVPVDLLSLTLKDLVLKYGNLVSVEKHAKILKTIMETTEKEQRLQERRLALIEKDFVISKIFQFIEMLMVQLLEYPDGIADDIVAKVLSEKKEARPAVVQTLKNGLSKILAGSKQQIIKDLESLKSKYNAQVSSYDAIKAEIKNELETEHEL